MYSFCKIRHLTVILLFFSCQNSPNEETSNKADIVVSDHQDAKNVELEELFQNVQYVRLETTSNNHLGEISDITIANNSIYILDQQMLAVFAFTIDGKFLFKISDTGRGPGEFMNPEVIYVNDDGVFIMDRRGRKILRYSLDGEYLDEKKLNYPFFEFVINDKLVFTNSRNYATDSFDKTLHVLEMSGEVKESIIPNYSGLENRPWSLYQNFYLSGENIFFIPDFSTSVYQINNNDVDLIWEIAINQKWFESNDWKFDGDSHNFINYVNSNKAVFGITGFADFTDYIFFGYTVDRNGFFNFYNSNSSSLISFKVNSLSNSEVITNRIMPWKICDGIGVYVVSSDVFINKLTYKNRNDSLMDISIGDNPIVVLTHFKRYEDLENLYK